MILGTICARGGSKGLPGKNTKPLLGKPLIAHSIEQAQQSGLFDHIAISSDSDEILDIGIRYGLLPIRRPEHLATDESGKIPVIVHAVNEVEAWAGEKFDIVVDLDATSPLRLPSDIVAAVDMLAGNSNVLTVTPAHRLPSFNMLEIDSHGIVRLVKPHRDVQRRQDAPPVYDMNASIYVWNRDKFMSNPKLLYHDTQLYVMPKERSFDIDDQIDFDIVQMLMEKRANECHI